MKAVKPAVGLSNSCWATALSTCVSKAALPSGLSLRVSPVVLPRVLHWRRVRLQSLHAYGFTLQEDPLHGITGSWRKRHMPLWRSGIGRWPSWLRKRVVVLVPTALANRVCGSPAGASFTRITSSMASMTWPKLAFSRCPEEPTSAHLSRLRMQNWCLPVRFSSPNGLPSQFTWLRYLHSPNSSEWTLRMHVRSLLRSGNVLAFLSSLSAARKRDQLERGGGFTGPRLARSLPSATPSPSPSPAAPGGARGRRGRLEASPDLSWS
mmetsp:Transcript_9750/g.28839  ORF Transcript_9750/g.28839 Transcript_9750/m.28839 type:complete len:265 (-) Transcript_9750:86-880(-)